MLRFCIETFYSLVVSFVHGERLFLLTSHDHMTKVKLLHCGTAASNRSIYVVEAKYTAILQRIY